jgi:Uma2 family endonuclease
MTSVLAPPLDSFESPPFPVRRWTVAEYRRLSEIGVLTEDDRVELIEGWIVPKMTHNPPHAWTVTIVGDRLKAAIPFGWVRRSQCAINTPDSEPEPDVVIARGLEAEFVTRHPGPGDIELVVEVADTSLRTDRRKARLFAGAAIPCYWIINLNDRQIEVHSQPDESTRQYRDIRILKSGDQLPLVLDGQTAATFPVDQLLPPAE